GPHEFEPGEAPASAAAAGWFVGWSRPRSPPKINDHCGAVAEEEGVDPTEDAFAPSNGFEDRASHRARCSSAPGLAEHVAAAQQDPSVSLAPGRSDLVEIFENLDGQIAPNPRPTLEGGRSEGAFGRVIGEFARNLGEVRQGLSQKEAVAGDPGDAAEPLGTHQKT